MPRSDLVGDGAPEAFAALEFTGIERSGLRRALGGPGHAAAYANADGQTGEALFGAAMVDGQLSEVPADLWPAPPSPRCASVTAEQSPRIRTAACWSCVCGSR